jgi:hypothetical protein
MWLELVVWYPSTSQYSVFHRVNSAITFAIVLSILVSFQPLYRCWMLQLCSFVIFCWLLCHLSRSRSLRECSIQHECISLSGHCVYSASSLSKYLMFESSHLGYSFVSVCACLISFQLWCLWHGVVGHTSFSDRSIYWHSYLRRFYRSDCAWV